MKNIKSSYAPAIAWGIFVFVLSVLPGKDFPSIPDWGDLFSVDKIVHVLFYGLLTWLILFGKLKNIANPPRVLGVGTEGVVSLFFAIAVAAFSSAYGWFLEWFQGAYCEDRMADVMDGVANTIGATLGLLVFLYFQRKKLSSKDV